MIHHYCSFAAAAVVVAESGDTTLRSTQPDREKSQVDVVDVDVHVLVDDCAPCSAVDYHVGLDSFAVLNKTETEETQKVQKQKQQQQQQRHLQTVVVVDVVMPLWTTMRVVAVLDIVVIAA